PLPDGEKRQGARAAKAMRKYRPSCGGDSLLEGTYVGFGDLQSRNGDETVAKSGIFRCALLHRRAGLMRLFAIGAVVDHGREAVRLELPERLGRRLAGNGKFV